MTVVIEPGELLFSELTIQKQVDVKVGEWVEVRKLDYRQRMRVRSNDGRKVVLEWP